MGFFALTWLVEKELYLRIPLSWTNYCQNCHWPEHWECHVLCHLAIPHMYDNDWWGVYISRFSEIPFLFCVFRRYWPTELSILARLATHPAFVDGIALPILNPEAMMRCKTWRDYGECCAVRMRRPWCLLSSSIQWWRRPVMPTAHRAL